MKGPCPAVTIRLLTPAKGRRGHGDTAYGIDGVMIKVKFVGGGGVNYRRHMI